MAKPISRRPSDWERVCFACPPDLKVSLERLVAAFGEGQGAYLRFLIRQEARFQAPPSKK